MVLFPKTGKIWVEEAMRENMIVGFLFPGFEVSGHPKGSWDTDQEK